MLHRKVVDVGPPLLKWMDKGLYKICIEANENPANDSDSSSLHSEELLVLPEAEPTGNNEDLEDEAKQKDEKKKKAYVFIGFW